MQNTLQVNSRSISAHKLFADKGFGATAGNHTDAILSVLLGARTSTSSWLSSFFDWCRQPPGTALPPPGLLLRHFLRENIILGGIGLHLGLGHVAFACAADTTKLATPGTCGCIFAAALLLPNQGQTNALDQPLHKRRGMALAKPPSLFFNVQNVQKNDRYLFYSILPKIPAEIWCARYFGKILPTRYLAKIATGI